MSDRQLRLLVNYRLNEAVETLREAESLLEQLDRPAPPQRTRSLARRIPHRVYPYPNWYANWYGGTPVASQSQNHRVSGLSAYRRCESH